MIPRLHRHCLHRTISQALEREGAPRREEFTQLNRLKADALREVNSQLEMLMISDRLVATLNSKFAVQIPASGSPPPTAEKLLAVQLQIDELKMTQEKLQMRCESDGLFVALRSLNMANAWKPKDLARQITTGPSALKDANGAGDEIITKEQLTHWLGAKQVKYTEQSLTFFVTAVRLGKMSGKTVHVIKNDVFIKTFETIKVHPVDLGELPTGTATQFVKSSCAATSCAASSCAAASCTAASCAASSCAAASYAAASCAAASCAAASCIAASCAATSCAVVSCAATTDHVPPHARHSSV